MDKLIINPDLPVFSISVAAQELGVHQRTLRIYDEEKILRPKRSLKGKRMYSFNDLKRGEFIQYLTRKLGLNLAGVKITLGLLEKTNIPSDNYGNVIREIELMVG